MRIAHILRKYRPSEWGGTESVLEALVAGLNHHGTESLVYYPAEPRETANPEPSANGNGQSDPLSKAGALLQRYQACVPVWGLPKNDRQQAYSIGGNLYSFDLPGMIKRQPHLSLVHSHALGRLGGIGLTIARRRKIPFVVTIHGGVLDLPAAVQQGFKRSASRGLDWGKFFGWWWGSHRVLEDANAILTCNPSEATLLRQRYPGKRIVVHPHGVPAARFQQDQRAAAHKAFPAIAGRKLILSVGRIDPVKNQAWLLRRMPALLRADKNRLLVLAGSVTNEAYAQSLRHEIRTMGLQDSVLLTGGLPPGDPRLVGLYQQAEAVVMPSIAETFGIIILEAWASGTPILSSRTSGALSLVRHGENGWLFDLKRPETFHSALEQTLANPQLASRIRSEGQQIVSRDYDTVILSGRIQKLYAELIDESRTPRHPA